MAGRISSVAIITKINNVEAEKAATRIVQLLRENEINTFTLNPLQINGAQVIDQNTIEDIKLDLVFAIGGDGTTLRAFRIISKVPVFSMNVGGNRGVLSEAGVQSIDTAINQILEGKYFYDTRIRIQPFVDGIPLPPALNDLFITRINLTRTPFVTINFMGDEINQRMDGIIVSTPTGSTGHSFSFDGPVLHEGMDCIIISPIASINRMPSIVIPSEKIQIRLNYDATLILDGQESYKIPSGNPVEISRYSFDAVFLRLRKKGMRQLAKLGY